ncbi:MAG: hypothetical protein M3P98_03225 [bacterium]|nr:hypothetical protein [bacterium]
MDGKKNYGTLALILTTLGIGVLLGNSLATQSGTNSVWVGIGSIVLGAVVFGMYLSSGKKKDK